jgi:lipopolysaccharide/colanic/teichoic acid biosynthesis glycosyltransferase
MQPQGRAPVHGFALVESFMVYPVLKRLFDIFFSALGLLFVAPLLLLVALVMKLTDSGPVFYRQARIGRFGVPFQIWKIRTMVAGAETLGPLITQAKDPRMTRIGRLLRKAKIDELPQFWNVLKGEMSFVGPRPQVPRFIERLTPAQRAMLQHRPGITDMATVKFRNEQELLSGAADVDDFYIRYCLPRKTALNLQYARQASLPYDIWILVQTLCPYWVGVVALYAAILVASFVTSYALHFDFHITDAGRAELWSCLPWVVVPQLILLVLLKQCRGLVSYFSFVEMVQISQALGFAFLIHLFLRYASDGDFAATPGIIATDFVLSLWAITWARLLLRFLRESQSAKHPAHRVAIVGSGELGTRVALDILNSDVPSTVVAFFDDDPHSWNKRPFDIPVIGMPECLLNKEWRSSVDEVIVALPEESAARAKEILEFIKTVPLRARVISGGLIPPASSAAPGH